MATPDLDVIKEIPGYKVILKAILKSQIQQLVEQLATHTDEESVILTASVSDGTLSHLGSDSGKSFLDDHEDVKSQFLGFCLKRHHRKKQEKEREKLEQEKQETLRSMAARRFAARPSFMPNRSPRQQFSSRFTSPRQQFRSQGMRPEPYPVHRLPNRTPPNNSEMYSPPNLMKSPVARKLENNVINMDGQVIKIEADDPRESESNQSLNDSNNQNVSVAGAPGETSSSQPSSPSQVPSRPSSTSQMKTEQSDKDDDANSDSSSSTIPNEASDLKFSDTAPPEGLSLDSDLSNLISGEPSSSLEQSTLASQSTNSSINPDMNVKVEAITESEMELEITGVEPGRMPNMGSGSQDNWEPDGQGGMFDPSGAMGTQDDIQGYSQNLLSQDDFYLQTLQQHQQSLSSDFRCVLCEKSFRTKSKLSIHMRIHTGEKPFECDVCHRKFNVKSNLNAHKYVQHQYPNI